MPLWKSKNPGLLLQHFANASRLIPNTLPFTGAPLALLFSPRYPELTQWIKQETQQRGSEKMKE